MKKKICILYTGGTIGMVRDMQPDGRVILRSPENPTEFLDNLKVTQEVKQIADITFEVLLNKDSTNMLPEDWTTMAKAVYERREKFDGFVIAHGTDTLHFSASALAFAFGQGLNFPIVFTGAQTAPYVIHGDARVNLLRALKVACEDIAEVVIVFGDFVLRGCRTQKKDERLFNAFESPTEFPLGYVTEQIVFNSPIKRQQEGKFFLSKEAEFQPYFDNNIVQISLIPGLKPKILESILYNDDCQGVVLQSFGAGNVPNEKEYSFKGFIAKAVELQKPVIITSQFPANSTLESRYVPGVEAIEAGAIPTGNMTNAAATTKFRWVLYKVAKEIEENEILPKDKINRVKELMSKVFVNEMTQLKLAEY